MTPSQPNRQNLRSLIPIGLIALVCGSLLAITHYFAQGPINQQQKAFEVAQLRAVLGNTQFEIGPLNSENALFPKQFVLTQNKEIVGQLVQLTTNDGYNGDITFWLATQSLKGTEPKVIGVRVIHHKETPGLGDKLDLGVSDWVKSFEGQSLDSAKWDVKKYGGDFDQFSGATITPRAVVKRIAHHLEEAN